MAGLRVAVQEDNRLACAGNQVVNFDSVDLAEAALHAGILLRLCGRDDDARGHRGSDRGPDENMPKSALNNRAGLVGPAGQIWALGDQHSLSSKIGPRRPTVGFVMSRNGANHGLRNSKDLVDEDGATVIASPHTAKHN